MKKQNKKYPFENLQKFIREFVEENSFKIPELKWMNDTEFEVYTSKLEIEILEKFQDSKLRYYEKKEGIGNETEESMKKDILEILGTIDYRYLNDFEFATPRLNRDTRIIELNNDISRMDSYLAQNKDDKLYQESERPKLEELKQELDILNKDFLPETLFKIYIEQVVREEIQYQINTSKSFEYESEVSKDSIIKSKSDECKEKIFNKLIEKNEIIKLYVNNIKAFDSILHSEIRTLLPQLDHRFTSVISALKDKNKDKEKFETPEKFINKKLDFSPDKIVLTENIEKSNENKYIQIITVYIKGNKKIGSNFPFETMEQYEKRKTSGFLTIDEYDSMMTPKWEKEDVVIKDNETIWDFCKRLNDMSYSKLNEEISEWENKAESETKNEWLLYFNNVQGKLDEWYYLNKNKFQTKIPFPSRKMKDTVIEITQTLFDSGELKYQGEESETEENPIYSPTLIEELDKIYIIDEKKKESIIKYFTRGDIQIKKEENGKILVKKY